MIFAEKVTAEQVARARDLETMRAIFTHFSRRRAAESGTRLYIKTMNFLQNKKYQIYIFIFTLILIIWIFGRNLNPFDVIFFTGHDETQAARVAEFTYNLEQGQIPPRIAPHFSYGLGYPIFNYYAPFPYWVVSGLDFIGFDIVAALEIGYILAMIIGFTGMYFLLRSYFSFYAALVGAIAYLSSPYIAVDIFVRGNLGEMWAFALLPLTLYFLKINSKKIFVITFLTTAALFTSHNILSPISLAIVVLYILVNKSKLLNFSVIGVALLLDAYFLIPAITELGFVQAASLAVETKFTDHFLCLSQLWSSPWGFAGSAQGCSADGMSFMIGKLQILTAISGILFLVYRYYKKQLKDVKTPLFFLILMFGSVFMTTSLSQFLWEWLKPITALFQFPWRFLIITVFGMAFFIAYLIDNLPKDWRDYAGILIFIVMLAMNQKFFYGQNISLSEFKIKYLSENYIKNNVAYKIAEYLPKSADYKTWRSIENTDQKLEIDGPVISLENQDVLILQDTPLQKIVMAKTKNPLIANIHYAPYWKITINQEEFIPTRFDSLGRPIIPVSNETYDGVVIKYEQTDMESIANWITFFTFIGAISSLLFIYKLSWKIVTVKKI